jgi:hypothetical protein
MCPVTGRGQRAKSVWRSTEQNNQHQSPENYWLKQWNPLTVITYYYFPTVFITIISCLKQIRKGWSWLMSCMGLWPPEFLSVSSETVRLPSHVEICALETVNFWYELNYNDIRSDRGPNLLYITEYIHCSKNTCEIQHNIFKCVIRTYLFGTIFSVFITFESHSALYNFFIWKSVVN